MKARLKAMERKLGEHLLDATGVEGQIRHFVGDGQRWQETVFSYSDNVELAQVAWQHTAARTTNATLERLTARGVEVTRTLIPAAEFVVPSSFHELEESSVE